MSTITVQTISNGSVSTSSANVINGSAKAWVNFNGTGTVAIRASYNVTSITDNGTGDYTVNFINAMPDANYAVTGIPSLSPGNGTVVPSFGYGRQPNIEVEPTASGFRFSAVIGSAAYDSKYNNFSVFR